MLCLCDYGVTYCVCVWISRLLYLVYLHGDYDQEHDIFNYQIKFLFYDLLPTYNFMFPPLCSGPGACSVMQLEQLFFCRDFTGAYAIGSRLWKLPLTLSSLCFPFLYIRVGWSLSNVNSAPWIMLGCGKPCSVIYKGNTNSKELSNLHKTMSQLKANSNISCP